MYDLTCFLGLQGPDFLTFGLGTNTLGGLQGPVFFFLAGVTDDLDLFCGTFFFVLLGIVHLDKIKGIALYIQKTHKQISHIPI